MNENIRDEIGYTAFLDMVAECVTAAYNGRVTAEKSTSAKNNGVHMTGLMLKKEGDSIAPNFYLEQQYCEWKCGKRELYDVVSWLCHSYEEERTKNRNLAEKISLDWESFQKRVFVRLVNRNKNEELLKTIPYEEFMDLALVYYYSVELSEEIQGTMVVTKQHLELLKISREELHETALKNTREFCPVRLYKMEDLILKLGARMGIPTHDLQRELSEHMYMMYILSNQKGMFGAVAMTFPDVLAEFAKKLNGSFYVLPSSIHEVILIPAREEFSAERFADIVCEVNEKKVEATEVLSDSVYFYDYNDSRLKRVR